MHKISYILMQLIVVYALLIGHSYMFEKQWSKCVSCVSALLQKWNIVYPPPLCMHSFGAPGPDFITDGESTFGKCTLLPSLPSSVPQSMHILRYVQTLYSRVECTPRAILHCTRERERERERSVSTRTGIFISQVVKPDLPSCLESCHHLLLLLPLHPPALSTAAPAGWPC